MNIKCWTEGVYVGYDLLTKKVGVESLRYGVGHLDRNTEVIHQSYYQWIVPVFAINCLLLFLPRVLWRILERQTMEKLLSNTSRIFAMLFFDTFLSLSLLFMQIIL
jgi:Innexin